MQPSSPLSFRDYRYFLVSRFATVFAQNMLVVLIGWQAYVVSRAHYGMGIKAASLQLGLIGLVEFVPLFLLSPFAGLAADRYDRRRVGQVALASDAMIAGLLIWANASAGVTLPLLFLASGLHGTVRGFIGPALGSLAPNLVPLEVLPKAIATGSIAWQLGSITGPIVGGFLIAQSTTLPYALAVGLMAIAVITIGTIRPIKQIAMKRGVSPFREMGEGARYVWHNKILLGCISLDLFAVLLGGATAMLPAFARDILHVGANGLGLLRAASGAGAATSALYLSARPIKVGVGKKMLASVGVFGAVTALFGLSRSFPLSLLLLFILGIADMISVFIRGTLQQIYTPDAMRGRVSAISGVFISASNELGEAESGILAALVGPVVAVVAGGVGAIAIVLLWSRLFPALRGAHTFDPPAKEVLT